MKPLLSARNVCKFYPIYAKGIRQRKIGEVKACNDVSFDLYPGETLGIVGESGSGKTTTARTLLGALKATSGQAWFRQGDTETDLLTLDNRRFKPFRKSIQMIFQDPFASLNPRMTIGDIVAEPLVIHRIGTKAEREKKVSALLERVGLKPEHRLRYAHAFSGGQRQRVGIARALILNPSLVVADEAVSALDVSVQAQVLNLLKELQREFQLTYIFVAHDLSVVKHICDRVAVMYAGRIVEIGRTEDVFANPRHPYTRMLFSAVPLPDPDTPMNFSTDGEVADPANPPPGCSFHPRCAHCMDRCRIDSPRLVERREGHAEACHLYD